MAPLLANEVCISRQEIEEGTQAAEDLAEILLASKSRPAIPSERLQRGDTMTCKKRRLERKTSVVRFSDHVIEHKIPPVDDFSSCWYSDLEYDRIKEENIATLRALQRAHCKVQSIDANQHCLRGLELHIAVYLLKMPLIKRKRAVQKVLNLQAVQRKMQRPDANALREISSKISEADISTAQRAASIDAFR
jgi:hypothetical protein